ncbi:MAG: hypothetical protein ACK5NY_00025 [Burkholderiaceae bacterium]
MCKRLYLALSAALVLLFLLSANVHAQTSPANVLNYSRASAFEYDATSGLLMAEIVEPDNPALCVRTEYRYDAYGNKVSTTVKNCPGASGAALFTARTSTVSFAATTANPIAGQFPTNAKNALGQTESRSFDPRTGQPTSLTGPNGLTTTWQYDSLGRKTLEVRADGNRTVWQYAYCGQRFGATGVFAAGQVQCSNGTPHLAGYQLSSIQQNSAGVSNGPMTKETYDVLGRLIRSEQTSEHYAHLQIIAERSYDRFGQLAKTTEPVFSDNTSSVRYATTRAYDAIGRLIQTQRDDKTAPGGKAISSIAYNGRTTTTTNPLGQKRIEEKDPLGRLARVTDAQGNQLAYQYDAFDNLLKTVDALGELLTQTDAKGQVTTNTYDVLGRLTQKTQPTQTATWSYDKYADGTACAKGIGQLCETSTDSGYKRRLMFDNLGRPTRTDTWLDRPAAYTQTVTYDANGRISSQTWPTGVKVNHTYNSVGGLNKVSLAASGGNTAQTLWQFLGADPLGHVTVYQFGNGIQTLRNYSADTGRPDIVWAGAGNSVVNHYYWYDSAGNVTARRGATTTRPSPKPFCTTT